MSDEERVTMPKVMTEEMRDHWRSAFLSGLHNRRGRGVVGDARKLKHASAEEAAWKSLVKKYGRPVEDDGADSLSPAKLGALFLGAGRADAIREQIRMTVEARKSTANDEGPLIRIYEGRPKDLDERVRLEQEIIDLAEERTMLINTVVFNEVTHDAKVARLAEIERIIPANLQKIDLLDCPSL